MGESALSIIEENSVTVVAISGPMVIDRINALRAGMLEAFGTGKNVQLSLAAVTEVDLTGLQLLCSAHRTSLAGKQTFSVIGCECEGLSSAAQQAGMLRHVGCAQDVGGTCVWKREAVADQVLE